MTRHETLLAQLRTYEPADALEAGHRAAMFHLLTSDGAFSRGHFAPGHFTASCYVIDDGGRLLLHHHRRLDRWLQMGGHVEGEETTELAALREATEESGLDDLTLVDGIVDLDIHPIPAGKGEPDHAHFDVRYVARTRRAEAVRLDHVESNDLRWFALLEAADVLTGEESQRVLRKIERILRERSDP
jgi:8-oxo-dGTP pyrophosphatase MutT (NUDIX family)